MLVDFERLTDSAPGPVLLVTPSGEIVAGNPEARSEFGRIGAGKKLTDMATAPSPELLSYLRECSGQGAGVVNVLSMRTPAGIRRYRCVGAIVQAASNSSPALVVLWLTPKHAADDSFVILNEHIGRLNAELSTQLMIREKLERALSERSLLLREIHHRVKNNLQIIVSMLSFQIRQAQNAFARQSLAQAQSRIRAIGIVQSMLYQNPDLDAIDAATMLQGLCHALWASIGNDRVKLDLDLESEKLSFDVASVLGLIVNELVTNALKHAFPGERSGTVRIGFYRRGGELCLAVSDDGIGFSTEKQQSGLGLVFVRAMASNLDASLQTSTDTGTAIRLVFSYARER